LAAELQRTPRLPEDVRHHFPICERQVYLNACSQGALSDQVREAYGAYLRDWEERGAPWEYWVELSERARAAFADLINATPDEVAVTTSVSAGVSAVLSAFQPGKRDTIVTSEFEFPTVGQIAHAQELRGARVVHVGEQDGMLSLAGFDAAIDERTALVAVTHVCYRNGSRTELEGIVELAHAQGVPVLVDAYQAAGAVPIDVRALNVDFLATGTVKYLLGSAGLGFLYARADQIERWTPTQTGWFADEDIFAMDIDDYSPSPTARRFEAGTPPVPNIYAGLAGMGILASVGVDRVEQHVRELTAHLDHGLDELGASIVTPRDSSARGPMTAIRSTDEHALVEALAADGIIISSRDGNVRVSPHVYNSLGDIDALLDGLREHRALLR
jgi:selenocysteine lyase/cysteine desulfurase